MSTEPAQQSGTNPPESRLKLCFDWVLRILLLVFLVGHVVPMSRAVIPAGSEPEIKLEKYVNTKPIALPTLFGEARNAKAFDRKHKGTVVPVTVPGNHVLPARNGYAVIVSDDAGMRAIFRLSNKVRLSDSWQNQPEIVVIANCKGVILDSEFSLTPTPAILFEQTEFLREAKPEQ